MGNEIHIIKQKLIIFLSKPPTNPDKHIQNGHIYNDNMSIGP